MDSVQSNHVFLATNPLLQFYLFITSLISRRYTKKTTHVQKILVCNTAHFGDIAIANAFVEKVKEKYPEAQIDFLGSSFAQEVCTGVRKIFVFNHWRLFKTSNFWAQLWNVIVAVRKEKYDLIIDTYPYYPNAGLIVGLSGSKMSSGFTSGGWGGCYQKKVPWKRGVYIGRAMERLIEYKGKQHSLQERESGPIVVHLGTGDEQKAVPREAFEKVLQGELDIVCVGKGEKEKQLAEGLGKNCVDQLSFEQLRHIVQSARKVVCQDSVVMHLAYQYGVPATVLVKKRDDLDTWIPPGVKRIIF